MIKDFEFFIVRNNKIDPDDNDFSLEAQSGTNPWNYNSVSNLLGEAGGTKYYVENKDAVLNRTKEHYKENRERILNYQSEKVTCECGMKVGRN
ncbi:MAG: hypothetical protein WCK35_23325, partial [Chloroflexota bacterium]